MIDALVEGFRISLSWVNLIHCFLGVTIGTFVGVLPGLGPAATIALLLPFTYRLDVTTAIIFLAGIYYGVSYGGTNAGSPPGSQRALVAGSVPSRRASCCRSAKKLAPCSCK